MKYAVFLISPIIFFSSCTDEDNQYSRTLDSLKSVLETSLPDDTSASRENLNENFDNLLTEFGKRYSISPDWNKLNKNNRAVLKKKLAGKFIIIPVTELQISGILKNGFSDTSIVFTDNSSNAFVFDIDGSISAIEKIGPDKNGFLLLKINKISDSMKLYLAKKGKDFRFSELRVTEFVITCELIDASGINLSDTILLKKFSLSEF